MTRPWFVPALAVFACALVLVTTTSPARDPLAFTLSLVSGIAIACAPRWSIVSFGIMLAVFFVLPLSDTQILGLGALGLPIALAACAAKRSARQTIGLTALALLAPLAGLVRARELVEVLSGLLSWWVVMVVAAVLGSLVRRLRRNVVARAEQAEKDLAEQRLEIARQLHDTLVYANTAMVMRAEQLRLRGNQDQPAVADLEFIAATGRQATQDLRTMLGVLRNEAGLGPAAPAASLADSFRSQCARLAAAGFSVRSAMEGPVSEVANPVGWTLGHVLTEGASNIIKHAPPRSEVVLMVEIDQGRVEVMLANAISKSVPMADHLPLGLVGLRERVAAHDGTLEVKRTTGAWVLSATLPTR